MVDENNATITQLQGYDMLKRQIIRLQKDILTEQTKNRALYEELQHPMNVHRWRVLESSDPQRYEKITLIQDLQKQLIAKADDVIEKDLLIQEKEKVYIELKAIISRQPGPEMEEQLLTYQLTLKDKTKQVAAMEDELSMYREQVQMFKDEILDIDKKMEKAKKRWFKMQKMKASRD